MKKPIKTLKECIMGVIQSSLFISIYIASFWYFCCFFRRMRKRTDKYNVIFASFLASFAVLFEPQTRRTELALYLFPRLLESILTRIGFLQIPNAEVFIFAIALGIIMHCYHLEDQNIDSTYLNIFKKFWKTSGLNNSK